MSQATDVRHVLSQNDAEFNEWDQEHHRYEHRLNELAAKTTLSEEEEVEEKLLKKRKLALKDRMAEKIRAYQSMH